MIAGIFYLDENIFNPDFDAVYLRNEAVASTERTQNHVCFLLRWRGMNLQVSWLEPDKKLNFFFITLLKNVPLAHTHSLTHYECM